jgi:hypothetical protein
VFTFYCQYGDRLNTSYMSNAKMAKMAKDTGMVPHLVPSAGMDILYTKAAARDGGALDGSCGATSSTALYPLVSLDEFKEQRHATRYKPVLMEIGFRVYVIVIMHFGDDPERRLYDPFHSVYHTC